MRTARRYLVRSLLLFSLCLCVVGCGGGGGGVSVKGKVTNKGTPLKVSDKGMVQVTLIPADKPEANKFTGNVGADGTFTVTSPDGKGVPKGKYKVAVHQWDPYPRVDLLKGKYSDTKTTLVRDIDEGKDLDIDVGGP